MGKEEGGVYGKIGTIVCILPLWHMLNVEILGRWASKWGNWVVGLPNNGDLGARAPKWGMCWGNSEVGPQKIYRGRTSVNRNWGGWTPQFW